MSVRFIGMLAIMLLTSRTMFAANNSKNNDPQSDLPEAASRTYRQNIRLPGRNKHKQIQSRTSKPPRHGRHAEQETMKRHDEQREQDAGRDRDEVLPHDRIE